MDCITAYAKHNCPGSWNDSDMSADFYRMLMSEKSDLGLGVCADAAFPVTGDLRGRIMMPMKNGELRHWPEHLHAPVEALSSAITSLRQGAEWGMGAIDKVWPPFTCKLPFDPTRRAR
jgi:hypothetical protein